MGHFSNLNVLVFEMYGMVWYLKSIDEIKALHIVLVKFLTRI